MNGKPIRMTDLKEGDQLTAMIVTAAEPEVITEKDVQASLAAAEVEAAAEAAAPPAEAPAAAAAETPAADAPVATHRQRQQQLPPRLPLKQPHRPRSPRIDGCSGSG